MADCSDNGLSSSEGLRGRRGVGGLGGTSLQGFTSQHLPCGLGGGECGGGGCVGRACMLFK